jgi:hypothetical protein
LFIIKNIEMKKFEFTIVEQATIERSLIEKQVSVKERIKHYTDRLNTANNTDEVNKISALLRSRKKVLNDIKLILNKIK